MFPARFLAFHRSTTEGVKAFIGFILDHENAREKEHPQGNSQQRRRPQATHPLQTTHFRRPTRSPREGNLAREILLQRIAEHDEAADRHEQQQRRPHPLHEAVGTA